MRLTPEQRRTIDTAVSLKGMSITQWAIDHLVDDARRDIEEETVLTLPPESFDKFVRALDEPLNERAIAMLQREPNWA